MIWLSASHYEVTYPCQEKVDEHVSSGPLRVNVIMFHSALVLAENEGLGPVVVI